MIRNDVLWAQVMTYLCARVFLSWLDICFSSSFTSIIFANKHNVHHLIPQCNYTSAQTGTYIEMLFGMTYTNKQQGNTCKSTNTDGQIYMYKSRKSKTLDQPSIAVY